MELLHKSFNLKVKATDDESRSIEGYASTYGNVDQVGDMIVAGAFSDSLKVRMPKMLSQHDTDCVIGLWQSYSEDANGLMVKGIFADTEDGNDTYTLTKMGALDALSIGYSVVDAEYAQVNGEHVRILKKLDLWEVSIVTFPANPQAKITGVKDANGGLMTERQFEQFLRDVGLSQKESKIVLSEGYKALLKPKRRDGVDDEAKLTHLLTQFNLEGISL